MHTTKISFLIIAFSAFLLAPVFAKNQNTPDAKRALVEFRFVCDKPGPGCGKMVNVDNNEELFLENQPQFTIKDLGLARVVSTNAAPPAEIIFYFTDQAKQRLAKIASENIQRRLGIVVDGKLIMAVRMAESKKAGEITVSGPNITEEYARDLVSHINAITKMDEQKVKETFETALDYLHKGKYDLALSQFNKVIHVNPNRAESYGNRATIYYHKKEYAKSWDDVHKAEELGLVASRDFVEELTLSSGRGK